MTEDYAKTKWCPFARTYATTLNYRRSEISGVATTNRELGGVPDAGCMCIASACMAWRWRTNAEKDGLCGLIMYQPY